MRIHTGETNYSCTVCAFKSTQKSSLNALMREIHLNQRRSNIEQEDDLVM